MTFFGAFVFALAVLTSCGESAKKENKAGETKTTKEVREKESSAAEATTAGDCGQFVKEYEEFVDNYIDIFKKYTANPTDTDLAKKYTEVATKLGEMQEKAVKCTDKKYLEKIQEINTKIANAATGM